MAPSDLNVEALLADITQQLKQQLAERNIDNPYVVGIHSGGAWLAERLHAALELDSPLGSLDISFYRDDFTRAGLHPKVKPSHLPLATEDRHIVLVDDVLMTGRTIRAALNELFDFGRPASVTLVTLVELAGRELPIAADISGCKLSLEDNQVIKLNGPEPLSLEIRSR